MTVRYSELTADELRVLRVLAAIEPAYPDHVWTPGKYRPSAVLSGWAEWRVKQATPQVAGDKSRDDFKTLAPQTAIPSSREDER